MANKNTLFVMLVGHALKHSEANFSPNLTDLLCLRVAKVHRRQDLVIFLLSMTMTMIEPITFPLHMRYVTIFISTSITMLTLIMIIAIFSQAIIDIEKFQYCPSLVTTI